MTAPFGINFNMFDTGIYPALNSFGGNFISSPDSFAMMPFGLSGTQTNQIDSFCSTMMNDFAKLQQEFFQLLTAIMNNPNINHTPTADILSNFRPYDYSKHGDNGDKISKLTPKMQEKTMQLLDYAKKQGLNVSIISGYRTKEEQNELLKTRPQFAAKNSLHCQGKAIDIKITNGKDEDYKKLGDYAKSIRMRWGGDFKNPKAENWHFDLGWS